MWAYYWLTFPFEYSLILLFVIPSCIISFIVGIYDFIKQLFITNKALKQNNLKDNLTKQEYFDLDFEIKDNDNDILSIIIPCYNESKTIKPTLLYLDIYCNDHKNIEIILVDGNSPDIDNLKKSVQEIEPYLNIDSSQIKIINKANVSGRGTCQNVGVSCSKGKYLLFVHADTVLPKNYDLLIKNSLKTNKNILLGAFQFAIDRSLMKYPLPGIGWVEFFARFRNKLIKLPYGDQSLWIKRDAFIEIGGFKWEPVLEDIEFVFRCREIAAINNKIIYIDPNYAYCAPRRWEKNGVAKNTVWNQWIIFLFRKIGLTPTRIYEIYYGRKL